MVYGRPLDHLLAVGYGQQCLGRHFAGKLYYEHGVMSWGLTFKITILLGRNKNIEDQLSLKNCFIYHL
jgi:hypothetical protein